MQELRFGLRIPVKLTFANRHAAQRVNELLKKSYCYIYISVFVLYSLHAYITEYLFLAAPVER
jgi:hypothetical protein